MNIEALKYPVGKLTYDGIDQLLKKQWINDIATFPEKLDDVVSSLNEEQLNWIYRPEGWTIRQVVHHCADSHMNAQLRFKLALTEELPTIKPYVEAKWALLPDYELDVRIPLDFLHLLHKKWVYLLNELTDEELQRQYIHPEYGKTFDLNFTINMYAWHCRHHLAHVHQAIEHKGEF